MSDTVALYVGEGYLSEGCMSGCYWHGGSTCSRCGARLRCPFCGQFVREDHLGHECKPLAAAIEREGAGCV